ncbi:MAG: hypothetical protein VX899_08435 [Myxococcota bacterium]|nr:hypothetical protein [Myxococcota bacterium]
MTPTVPLSVVVVAAVAATLLLGMVALGWVFLHPMARPLLAPAPDWMAWASARRLQVEERGGKLRFRGELGGQALELLLPDRSGLLAIELTLNAPPPLFHGVRVGEIAISEDELDCGGWVFKLEPELGAWRLRASLPADQIPERVEALAAACVALGDRFQGDLDWATQCGFVPGRTRAEGRARALLSWTPNPSDPPPRPGSLQLCMERDGALLACSPRGWLVELPGPGGAFALGLGEGGARTGNPVLDLSLGASGAPPHALSDPGLSEDTLWLLHGHAGRLSGERLRFWVGPGELGEGLERAERLLGALGALG